MELNQLTIHTLQKLIRSGEVTSSDMVKSVFKRIDAVEGSVHAYITLMKDYAFEEASKADRDIKEGRIKPLTGIPIALSS